jgi:hypothetical protein
MRILHITYHEGTKKSIIEVCNQLNINITTVVPTHGLYITKEEANVIYNNEYSKLNYDTIITSDTCMVSRPFLQNMDKHSMNVIVYITNRIDWGLFGIDDDEYLELFKNVGKRVRIVADNNYDKLYASIKCNTNNLVDYVINPVFKLDPTIQTINKNKWFILNRGTNPGIYTPYLRDEYIVYDNLNKYKDFFELKQYIGCLHIPYQVNIQTIHEAWNNGIIFCIPTLEFFNINNFYWEETNNKIESFNNSIWYSGEYKHMFEYFNSWEECNALFKKCSDVSYRNIKIDTILSSVKKYNNESMNKWCRIINTPIHTMTVVSMYYQLKGKERRSPSKYLEYARLFLLQLPCPLIIYTDDDSIIKYCIENRKEGYNLLCINYKFNDTKYYKYIDVITSLQKSYVLHNGNKEHETPEYIVLNCNKFFFIEESIKLNPFNTEYFMWIDFGINHVADINNIYELEARPKSEKIIQLCINPLLCKEIEEAGGYKKLFRNIYHHLAGGCFSGNKGIMLDYCKKYNETLDEIIEHQFWQIDEALMTIISTKYPDMFDFYYGDYKSIINNNPLFKSTKLMCCERISAIILKYENNGYDASCVIKKIVKTFPYLQSQFNRKLI